MFEFLAFGVPLFLMVGLSVPVWVRTRSWLQMFRAMAAVLFGILLPLAVFLVSGDFQPDWKGACRLNWVNCFHVGKMVLLPVVLWAMAGFYAADVIRVDRALLHTWERWGVLNGAIVSGVCLAHLAALMVVDNRTQNMVKDVWWGLSFPLYTTVWYTYRAWQCWRLGPDPWMRSGCAVLPSLPCWIGSVLLSQHLYKQLPDVAPSCFVVTAASRGHPWLVGSGWARGDDGRLQCVNAQLICFRAMEAVWQRRSPVMHAAFRRVYNVWGYRAAGLIRTPWLADIAYLLLKPLEWLARIGTISPDPR